MSCTEFASTDFLEQWKILSSRFEHWEIFSEGDHCVWKIKDTFLENKDSFDMTYSLHTAISDTNIAHLNDIMWEASLKEFEKEIECASEMGLVTATVHPGIYNLASKNLASRSVERAKRGMKELDRMSKEYNVPVAIENMSNVPIMLGSTYEQLNDIVDGTNLGICLDIGHAHTMGQIDAIIDGFGDRIINIHIHDNMGDRDAHLTIGDGNIDFDSVLKKLHGYKGNFIIEAKSLESAETSQMRLKEMSFFRQ